MLWIMKASGSNLSSKTGFPERIFFFLFLSPSKEVHKNTKLKIIQVVWWNIQPSRHVAPRRQVDSASFSAEGSFFQVAATFYSSTRHNITKDPKPQKPGYYYYILRYIKIGHRSLSSAFFPNIYSFIVPRFHSIFNPYLTKRYAINTYARVQVELRTF
jgi:hypothetical protein